MLTKIQLIILLASFFLNCSAEIDLTKRLCKRGKHHNRKIVLKFYQKAFGDLEFDEAANEYLSQDYIQHNPAVADGIPGFLAFAKSAFKGANKTRVDIRATAAEGDLVWLHVRLVIQGSANAIVEIFRVNCSKIVEHWDVIQAIGNGPYANSHPFF